MASRFIARLNLPPDSELIIRDLRVLSEPVPGFVELYHASICSATSIEDRIQSILQHGFYPSINGNKAQGVYFANHGRYSLSWAGWRSPVFICSVEPGNHLKRYRSEIDSETIHNSEYVVTDPSKIIINCVLRYEVRYPTKRNRLKGFAQHACESCTDRCDCEQFPTVDVLDLIPKADL